MSEIKRIAMWSGPRNISTAMMRAWGNRADTVVCDEPLYAHYLLKTGLPHPGAAEVMAAHETDWRTVVARLTDDFPQRDGGRGGPARIWYQKHMAHHLLPEIDRGWLARLAHAFLIRDPREMLLSLINHISSPTLRDTGLPQQIEIFEHVRGTTGSAPPVIDARDVLEQPRRVLTRLCEALDVPFSDAMLSWPAGRHDSDGIWERHWYASVERSTTFDPYTPKSQNVPSALQPLLRECRLYYERLYAGRLH